MRAYYNEIDPFAVERLKSLIARGLITPGDVDERSIEDVSPTDLIGYDRWHLFAGIAGWDYALQLAGWPDDRKVMTLSCPCQSFSSAGEQKGFSDERHLWPVAYELIRHIRPDTIFGEQVEAAIRIGWLDLVFDDLEREGYSCGAAVLPACSVGAPHIRNRLWFVAQSQSSISLRESGQQHGAAERQERDDLHQPGGAGGLFEFVGHAPQFRSRPGLCDHGQAGFGRVEPSDPSPTGLMGHAGDQGLEVGGGRGENAGTPEAAHAATELSGTTGSFADSENFWSSCTWLPCRDGKWRPTGTVEPGLPPLADGLPPGLAGLAGWLTCRGQDSYERRNRKTMERIVREGGDLTLVTAAKVLTDNSSIPNIIPPLATGVKNRVGKLKCVGNSIVPQVAAEFIKAFLEVEP